MHRAIVTHFELGAKDGNILKRFYASLFGWRISSEEGGVHSAHCLDPNGPGIETVISEAGHRGMVAYVEVDDVLENLCYAAELGGRIIELPHEIVSGAQCVMVAMFADPEGNQWGLSSGFDRTSS